MTTSHEDPERLLYATRDILANEAFQKALRDIREAFVRELEGAPVKDRDFHHEVALMLQLLRQLERCFQSYLETGEVALRREEEKKSWLRRRESRIESY